MYIAVVFKHFGCLYISDNFIETDFACESVYEKENCSINEKI